MPIPVATPEDLDGLSRAVAVEISKDRARLAALEGSWTPTPNPTPTPTPTPPAAEAPGVVLLDFKPPLDGPITGRNWALSASASDYGNWPTLRPDYGTFPALTNFDRSDTASQAPKPYEAGELRLDGCQWPVEVMAGWAPPDSRFSHVLKQYVDTASKSWHRENLARASIQDRQGLVARGFGLTQTLWCGGSTWFTHLDAAPGMEWSWMQMRNQPFASHLAAQGIDLAAEAKARGIQVGQIDGFINGTGPCTSLALVGDGRDVFLKVEIRDGELFTHQPIRWEKAVNDVTDFKMSRGRWIDWVWRFTSSQGSDGRFTLWMWNFGDPVPATPLRDYPRATEYRTPTVQGIKVLPVPERYCELYGWKRRPSNGAAAVVLPVGSTDPNRFVRAFHGPQRSWIGDDGFERVRPR